MANFDAVKSKVRLDVKTNGNEDITGASLQEDLIAMLDVSQEADNERKAKEAELEAKDTEQDGQIALKADKATTEAKDAQQDSEIEALKAKDISQDKEIAKKANTSDVTAKDAEQDAEIAKKANTSDVNAKNALQDTEIAKKLNKADAVGKKTAEGGEVFNLIDRNTAETNGHSEGVFTHSSRNAHAEGDGCKSNGTSSHSEGYQCISDSLSSHSEGYQTRVKGVASHAEGTRGIAIGESSHIEGSSLNIASDETISKDNDGIVSDWEKGNFSLAKGEASHTEGRNCLALGQFAHAEGKDTIAYGNYSHAEGEKTYAGNYYGHAEGYYTKTTNIVEHAEGYYNKSNKGTRSSLGVGNSEDKRRNAVETMVDGKHYILNIGGYDGTNPTTAKDLATEFYGGGALRALYEAAKAKWNPATGFYELNGLTDITEKQMTAIYDQTSGPISDGTSVFASLNCRTNIKPRRQLGGLFFTYYDASFMFMYSTIEVAALSTPFVPSQLFATFYACKQMRKVLNPIDMTHCKDATEAFNRCGELTDIEITGLKINISFNGSPRLSEASLLYMINNEAAENQITITLESSAYDRLNALTSVQNALAAHPNVKLAK